MSRKAHKGFGGAGLLVSLLLPFLSSCEQLNDDRIPAMAVNVSLDNAGLWAAYGVHGFGEPRYFILSGKERQPAGFPYTYGSATGYGGILLIGGQNVYTGDTSPLAYDLACPVERMPEVRVEVDPLTFDAVCPVCGSHYNVVEGNGAPISGPAKSMHYAMTHYECYPTVNGGYVITR